MDTLELTVVGPTPRPMPSRRRYRWAPQDRPPATGRAFVGLLGFAALLTTAALLLSDSAPGILRTVFGDHARQIWERIDAAGRVDATAPAGVAQSDVLVHLALWAAVTMLAGIAIWTWRGLIMGVAALAVVSGGLELAQGRFSSARTVEASDAAANLAGVSLGALATAVCYLAWSAAASTARRLRAPRT